MKLVFYVSEIMILGHSKIATKFLGISTTLLKKKTPLILQIATKK